MPGKHIANAAGRSRSMVPEISPMRAVTVPMPTVPWARMTPPMFWEAVRLPMVVWAVRLAVMLPSGQLMSGRLPPWAAKLP